MTLFDTTDPHADPAPKHRRPLNTNVKWDMPTLARCVEPLDPHNIDEEDYFGCAKHSPLHYADQAARHRKDRP